MIFDPRGIRESIRTELEKMLDFVTGEEAQTATADDIERGLFRRLLKLGAKLLLLFFVTRAQNCSRESLQMEDGRELPYHSEKKRTYFSIFGKLPLWRPYFYEAGAEGRCPLDAELNLGSDCYSDFLREMAEYLGVYVVYNKVTDLLARFLDLRPGLRMNIIGNPGVDKTDFELWSFAVSSINGCSHCVTAHERTLREAGVGREAILEALKAAAIVAGVAQAITAAQTLATVG